VRGAARLALQRLHDDALDLGVIDLARHAGARLIEQPVDTALEKAPAPLADGLRGHPLARRHRLVAQARGASQNDPRPQCQALRGLPSLRIALQDARNFS